MKRKVLSLLIVMLVAALLATPASAGPGIDLKSVRFSLGSLIANGLFAGLGQADLNVVLDASGPAAITCVNHGGNTVPGQSYPKISSTGRQSLLGDSPVRKNGRSPFDVETEDPEYLPWTVADCPNSSWIGHVDFVFYEDATISVYEKATGALQLRQKFSCKTTRFPAEVFCTPVP